MGPPCTGRIAVVDGEPRWWRHTTGAALADGNPACPRLEDQEKLFRVLDVEGTTGVRLTEGYMMDPEASVSALVFHHPEARYFVIPPGDLEAFERRLAAGG